MLLNSKSFIVMQEASDAHSKIADSDAVLTYQVSSVQLVTDKKLEALFHFLVESTVHNSIYWFYKRGAQLSG